MKNKILFVHDEHTGVRLNASISSIQQWEFNAGPAHGIKKNNI